jgi:hypothetical protein
MGTRSNSKEVGSCVAIINKIQTTQDGGARLTLDICSEDAEIISKLMKLKLENKELITLGIISGE